MLKEEEIIPYWKERSEKLGVTAVGYGDQNLDKQDAIYAEAKKFVFSFVDKTLATLDYGCGIGRYSKDFDKYFGIDITENMIKLAKELHPDAFFLHIKNNQGFRQILDFNIFWIKQIFTSTVLQHCDDEVVSNFFKDIYNCKKNKLVFSLYENSMPFVKPHIVGRKPHTYLQFIQEAGFKIKKHTNHTHSSKGELHSLTIAEV